MCVEGEWVQVFTSSAILAQVRFRHIMVQRFVAYHINFSDPDGTDQDVFLLSQLQF